MRASTGSGSASSPTPGGRSTPPWPLPDDRPLYVLPTYTAMLGLRGILVDRGAANAYWEHD